MPVCRVNEVDGGGDEDQDGDELDADHHVVGRSRLANAADQDDSEDEDNEKGGNVEAEVPAGMVEPVAGQILQAFRQIGRRDPSGRRMEAEPIEQIDDMGGKADADSHVRAGIFEDQIPADDPGNQLAHGGVGVGVGRAGNRNHGGEFGITETGQSANKGDEDKRDARWQVPRRDGRPWRCE